jgi:hypothetical protein
MPRTMPAGTAAEFKKRNGLGLVTLLDLQLLDGTLYYWSDLAGSYTKKLGVAGAAVYSPWLLSAGPLRLSRSLATDAGDIRVQNISGDTLKRDLANAISSREFEGAFAVLRLWSLGLSAAVLEFDAFLTEPTFDESAGSFRVLQLLDPSSVEAPARVYSEQCTWRYKSPECGSTGSAAACPKDLASCKDATRAASERFNGVPTPPTVDIRQPWTFTDDNHDMPRLHPQTVINGMRR